ncbi:MAG: Ig-like domain-containing protein, partial [Candidatus Stygibacter australis]|nr:Ig-like domain-containing protein [Candidatus Stygibacter australis]
ILILTFSEPVNIEIVDYDLLVNFFPDENWHGSEIITFTVDDQQGRVTASDEVTIIVTPVNDPPIADAGGPYEGVMYIPDTCEITLNGTGSYDIDGEIVQWLWSWENGNAEGEEVLAEFSAGTTEITLTVTDNEAGVDTDIAQVIISSYENLAPVALADEYSLNEDTDFADNVMNNDYDPDESPMALIAELVSDVSNGTLDFADNGDFTYLPDLNWNGTDAFDYRVYDGEAYSEIVTVTLIVYPINDAPTIELPDSFTFAEDGMLAVDFANYVNDVDNVDLVLTVTGEEHINVGISDLIVTFTSEAGWSGSEVLIFMIDDNQARSSDFDDVEIIVTPGTGITLSKDLIPGWNWLSLNIAGDNMSINNVLSSLGNNAASIKSQTQSAIYYEGVGWYGSLTDINNFTFYKLNALNNVTWEYTGLPVDPQSMIYSLTTGWNWISYAPQTPEEINYALAALGNAGLNIKSQTQSSIYYEGVGWYGSLTQLQPLDGYMLKNNTDIEFSYPQPVARHDNFTLNQNEISRDFDLYSYEFNGTMVLSSKDPLPENSSIAAYVDGQRRSICTLLDYSSIFGRCYYSLMLYSNCLYEDDFELYYQEPENNQLQHLDYSFSFQADMTCGDYLSPVMINLPLDNGDPLPASNLLMVYPNPFNPETTIEFELKDDGLTLIEIYNVKGQKIETLVNESRQSGRYLLRWNAENHSTGIYYLSLKSGDTHQVKKLILLR